VPLRAHFLPPSWKKAKLVLLHKGPGKPVEAPSSFRLCLLDTPGKLLERLILQRLDSTRSGRAPNQFGFWKGISTEMAVEVVTELAAQVSQGNWRQKKLCVLVTLDVKNAFNSLRWPVIDEALREKDTPGYLVLMIRSWIDLQEKATALSEAEETFRLFYKMVEDILTLKETEERARQAADNAANG